MTTRKLQLLKRFLMRAHSLPPIIAIALVTAVILSPLAVRAESDAKSLTLDSEKKPEPSASGADSWLFEEPIAQSKDPHFFDWWSSRLDVELGANAVNESNNFKSQSYSLGLMYGLTNAIAIRAAYRQVSVTGSASSDIVGQTPYAQAAQSARSEILLGLAVPLMAGRSFTLISPWLGDLNHVLSLVAGAHYSFYPSLAHPFGGHAPDPLPGQTPITYRYAGELGLQMKVGLPHSLSAFVEFDYLIPILGANSDLPNWTTLGGGLAWSFAD